MFSKRLFYRLVFVYALASGWTLPSNATAASCVWKVSGPTGGTLYLAGSWHALRSTDYPLPGAFNRAFDASSRLAYEISPKDLQNSSKVLDRAGEYPKGDNLKNHVDPRTYSYLRRFFGLLYISEDKFTKYRPWYLSMMLEAPSQHGLSHELGVERFFEKRAKASAKPIVGLESLREHIEVFSGLSDRGSEALLLITFIPADKDSPDFARVMAAWRRGDADLLARVTNNSYHDYPAMGERLLAQRNRNWIPKIEEYLRSGQTYFVVVGAAHMGGPGGVLALLRARGYKIEQL